MKGNLCAIILAAGSGSRMNLDITKQKIIIKNKNVLYRATEAFELCEDVGSIIVVTREDELEYAKELLSPFKKITNIVVGGAERSESAKIGFAYVPENVEYVAIHDAARCFITPEMIAKVYADAKKYGAATASTLVTDTVKEVDKDGFIIRTYDRTQLRLMQTPQIFKCSDYEKALGTLDNNSRGVTDDNMLLERIGVKVFCTEIGKRNLKITTKEDIGYAEFLLLEEADDE